MMVARTNRSARAGGIYIVVLGTSMIVAVLGLSALVLQRLQNKMLTASADVRQAQLNAHTAVEIALLTMKQDTNWRTSQTNGNWFTGRGTGAGTCTVNVTDPVDSNLADDANEPVAVRGIGYSGQAQQRFDVSIDPRREPLSCLRYGVAATDIDLNSDTLRSTTNIAANTVAAASSQVYGNVEAVTISGSTYNGTNTTVAASKLPTMPDWSTVFSYYRNNGTEINVLTLPAWSTMNVGRNVGVENTLSSSDWNDTSSYGLGTAILTQSNSYNHTTSGTYSLRVRTREQWYSGAIQPIDGYVKPNQQYYVEAWVLLTSGVAKNFYVSLYTKGSGTAQFNIGPDALAIIGIWTKVSATITAPSWSGNLEYAFVKIAGDSSNTSDYYLDDLVVRETTTGRIMYRQVLSPSINPFGGTTNSQGIYWINCGGNKLVLERSRILGTLLVVNPGAGSCIANGPIHMSPAVSGYPALLVDADTATDADFAINATSRGLSEKENATNFNPTGAAHDDFGQDADTNDIYQSTIVGLVAIEDDLTYSNKPLIRGQLVVGDDISNSSGTLEIQYQPESLLNPPQGFWAPYLYVRRPISGKKSVLP